jgi:RHS repeat-associated protein
LGNVSYVVFDARGNVVREEGPLGGILTRTFDSEDRLLTQTTVIGLEDSSANGQTNDLTTTNVYDKDGNLLSSTDTRGLTTRSTYNSHGQPTSQTDAFGNTTYTNYGNSGLPTSIRDANGNVTSLKFDTRGNPTEIRDDNGNLLVKNTYNKYGEVLTSTSITGKTTHFEYDDNGNQVATWTTELKADGTPVKLLRTTSYDDEGKVIGSAQMEILNPDTAPVEKTITFSSTTYDLVGQVSGNDDQFSNAGETTYDIRGQQIESRRKAVNEAGETVWMLSRTVYDAAGRPVYRTDSFEEGSTEPVQGTHSYYDAAGRVIKTERLEDVRIEIVGQASSLSSKLQSVGSVIASSMTSFDNAGRTLTSTDDYNNQTVTTYNENGDVTQIMSQVKDENGAIVWRVSRTVYDEFGRSVVSIDSYMDATGTATSSGPVYGSRSLYDSKGRSIGSQRVQNVIVALDPATGETTLTDAGTVLYASHSVYDADGRLYQSISSKGTVTTNEYDSLGREVATVGQPLPLAEVGTSAGSNIPVGATTVALRSETVYSADGRVAKQRTNIRQFDTGDIDDSDVQETAFEYDYKGQTTKTISNPGKPNETFVTSEYDDFGRVIAETNQLGLTRTSTYNDRGQLIAVTLPAIPDPNNSGQMTSPVYRYSYDALGNMVQLTDPLGRDTRFVFDDHGQQLSRTLPLGFGADGMFGTSDDPVGQPSSLPFTERMEYDAKGRQSLHVSFEGVITEFLYDDSSNGTGRLKEKRFYADQADYDNALISESQTMTYDAFGREVSVVWDRTVSNPGSNVDTWTNEYDQQGRLLRVESPSGDINYGYDVLGRQTRVFTGTSGNYAGDLANPSTDIRYSYDILGRLSKVEAFEKNNVAVDVDPNTAGNQPETESYAYMLNGSLDYEINPDGSTTDYTYDDLNRLTDIDEYRIDPNVSPGLDPDFTDNPKLSEYSYSLRDDGKRDSADEVIYDTNGTTVLSHTQFDWTYDDAGRLTDEIFTDVGNLLDSLPSPGGEGQGEGVQNYHTSFEYDLTGNRLKQTTITDNDGTAGFNAATDKDEVITYGQDVNDRMISETRIVDGSAADTTTYGYTGTQQSSKSVVSQISNSQISNQTFSYDLQGRLAHVETFQGSNTYPSSIINYRYGTDGIRISSTTQSDTNADGTIDSVENTEYRIDAGNHTGYQQVLEETVTDGSGNLVKKIVYTVGHDHISQTTFTPGGPAQGTTAIFHMDGHGSTRILTDLAGAILTISGAFQIFHYTAYGNAINFQMANAATQYLYSGEQFDARIGQQYLRARYYNQANGTFNRLDPFFGNTTDPQSFHKYLYTHADPIRGIDPSGESLLGASFSMGIIGALAGFTIGITNSILNNPGSTNLFEHLGNGFRTAGAGFVLGFFWPISVKYLGLTATYSIYTLLNVGFTLDGLSYANETDNDALWWAILLEGLIAQGLMTYGARNGLRTNTELLDTTTVQESTGTRYVARDSAESFYGIEGNLNDGVLEFAVDAKYPSGTRSVTRGYQWFEMMWEHFRSIGQSVKAIKAKWIYGDNLATFNELASQGIPLEEAAASTWTGRQAAARGYTKANVVTAEPASGPPYTDVEVYFTK